MMDVVCGFLTAENRGWGGNGDGGLTHVTIMHDLLISVCLLNPKGGVIWHLIEAVYCRTTGCVPISISILIEFKAPLGVNLIS